MSEITAFVERKYGSRGDQGRLVCDRLEQLWSDHRCFADRHFLTEFCSSDDAKFIQRYWEMRLGELLRAAGWQLSSSEEGPDFRASKNDRVVWVEAIAPEAGTTEDRLSDDYLFPDLSHGGIALWVPAEKIVLRVRTAIDSKHKAMVGYTDRRGKYHPGYRDRGIVDAKDAYVIAVNTALLGTCGDMGSHLPSVVEAVFPTGPLEVVLNRKTRKVIREGICYRPVIRKQNDAPVFTNLFLDEVIQRHKWDYGPTRAP